MNNLNHQARYLRNNMTKQERILWNYLRKRSTHDYRFRRQFPIGKYIVDFICREKRLIIEIDGSQHNENQNIIKDKERTEFFEAEGYKVIRFWNNDIDNNIEGVYEEIVRHLL